MVSVDEALEASELHLANVARRPPPAVERTGDPKALIAECESRESTSLTEARTRGHEALGQSGASANHGYYADCRKPPAARGVQRDPHPATVAAPRTISRTRTRSESTSPNTGPPLSPGNPDTQPAQVRLRASKVSIGADPGPPKEYCASGASRSGNVVTYVVLDSGGASR